MSAASRQAAALRYRPWSNLYYYAHGKIALDPAYPLVARTLKESNRPLLDIGCGMGLLAAYLRAHEHCAPIIGMDVDGEKVNLANDILGQENARFYAGDALTTFPEHSGDVVMLDVLHYFSDEQQQQLLEKMAASVAPGGVVLIRVTLNEPTLRFALTRLEEWFVKFSRWIPVTGSNFPTRDEVAAPFRRAGLEEDIRPMWGMTPFNSYLFSYRRPA
jgi:trans-aconitate methyltransferase